MKALKLLTLLILMGAARAHAQENPREIVSCPQEPAVHDILKKFRDLWGNLKISEPPGPHPVIAPLIVQARAYDRKKLLTFGSSDELAAFENGQEPIIHELQNTTRQIFFELSTGQLVDVAQFGKDTSWILPGAIGTPDNFTFVTVPAQGAVLSQEACRSVGPSVGNAPFYLICRVVLNGGYNYQIMALTHVNGLPIACAPANTNL